MAFRLKDLNVKLFTDGADKAQILEMAGQPWIRGFTTNPSLMKAAKVSDYRTYARELVEAVPNRHISFEVFSDDIAEMVAQARVIDAWGPNVYVKLPVSTTRGEPLFNAVRSLSQDGIKVNLTAVFTAEQAASGVEALAGKRASLCVGVRRASGRCRHRLSTDHARRRRASAPDRECRSHLGIDARGLQRDRGRRNGLPHHHCPGRRAEEIAGAWNEDGRRIVARRGKGLPRGCRVGRADASGCRVTRGRVMGLAVQRRAEAPCVSQ